MFGCGGGIWKRDDFAGCFQREYLQFLLPLVASGASCLILLIQFVRRAVTAKQRKGYSLLKGPRANLGRLIDYDGIVDQVPSTNGRNEYGTPVSASVHTPNCAKEISRPRGEAYVVLLEIVSVFGEVAIHMIALLTQAWGPYGISAAIAGVAVWSYICALAVCRFIITSIRFNGVPRLWNHTAVLYSLQWLFTVLLFRSAILYPRSRKAQLLTIIDFVLVSVLVLVTVTSRKGNKRVILEHEDNLEPSKEPLASLLSLATFGWVDAIVWQGYKKTFELADVWNLAPKDKAAVILANFRQLKKTSRLAWHLLRYFRRDLLIQAAWAFLSALFTFVPTLLLKAILEYVEDPEVTPVNTAWLYIFLLTFSTCVQAVTDGQALWKGRKICIRLRAVIIGEIYAKALRRKASAGTDTILGQDQRSGDGKPNLKKSMKERLMSMGRKKQAGLKQQTENARAKVAADSQVNAGTIINLMAVDSFKVGEISAYLHFLWVSAPVLLIVCVVLLYRILGYSSLASIGLLILVMPLNFFIARGFTRKQKIIMAATDARIHSTNEVLQNIRIIKYFAWERRFGEIVNEKRSIELRALRNRYILWAFAATVWFGVPLLITFFSFLLYTKVEKKPLKPSVAFTALSLFGILRVPLDQFADMLAHVQESKVSVDRVEEFLNEDETEKYSQLLQDNIESAQETSIGFRKATFTWGGRASHTDDGSKAFRMIDLDIQFHVGKLNIIAGPTGSGKTSLLMALLGEMRLLRGSVSLPSGRSREELRRNPNTGLTESVAYCAQQAWLVNDTIKQNILFASPWDKSRYQKVIAACALERDLEILADGDSTLVGEKGITLSGGQKQRISLARAIYCNSRHVLLDDCLSAVDSETAKHLFERCILGPLMKDRTCILVTHNISLCVPRANHVVTLINGKIIAQGPPDEVMSSGALGEDILQSSPTSKYGTGTHSPTQPKASPFEETTLDTSGATQGVNGHVSLMEELQPIKSNGFVETVDTMAESKAEGGVKMDVIKMYLAAMGPWYYWILTFLIFAAQQLGSIATNVWIREWANSYQTDRVDSVSLQYNPLTTTHVRGMSKTFTSSYLSTGSYPWILPTFNSSLVANATAPSDQVDVLYYLGGYALLSLIYLAISFAREGLVFWGSLKASWKIHSRLLESVTRAKFKFFDSTPLGQMMNRFSKDIEAIDQEVAPVSVGFLGCASSIISIVILICVITPRFLVPGVFITLLYFAIGAFYIRSSRDLKRLESVQRSPLYQHFGETLSGIVTIRAYRDERRFIRDNQLRVDTHNRPFFYLWAANRWLAVRVDLVGALVAFFAGAFVILSVGKIDAGAAGLSLSYAITFTENVLWLVRLYSVNEQNMNSVERVKEYLEIDQEARAVIPETRPPGNWPSQGAIHFINYSTRYRLDLEPVLKNVTFVVRPGEKVGIVGRTGAGKSSLALALFRGLEAEEGKILIDDIDIGLIGLQDLREAITMVPQDPTLFTGTIRSNLDPFGLFTDEEIFNTLRRVQLIGSALSVTSSNSGVHEIEALVTFPKSTPSEFDESDAGLNLAKKTTDTQENVNIFTNLLSPVAESGSNLSQGQRQLLCLARALLKSPRVLLMDEATASIDYATDGKIQETLREVKESTIITIAHRLQTIIDYDKVLVLDKGEVVEYDSPSTLISREGGAFRGMCEMSGHMETLIEGAKKAQSQKKLIDV